MLEAVSGVENKVEQDKEKQELGEEAILILNRAAWVDSMRW